VTHSAPPDPRPRGRRREHSQRPPADAASRRGRWQRQIPYAIVICGLAAALVWMRRSEQNVRGGTLAVAGILLAAALFRLALPARRAGMLVSRHRTADVAVLTAFGIGLLVAGLVLPPQ
jgi:hypothetical protein